MTNNPLRLPFGFFLIGLGVGILTFHAIRLLVLFTEKCGIFAP